MEINSDWHIHSHNSCDCKGTGRRVSEIVATTAEKGITDFGLSDHLHTPFNLPDIRESKKEFLACVPRSRFHFGVEVSCVSEWEINEIAAGNYDSPPVCGLRKGGPAGGALAIGLTSEDIEDIGIEYVIGGTHWPIYVPFRSEFLIRDYHRQNMFLATHSLVDIVAHPWWFLSSYWDTTECPRGEPWFNDFGKIPKSMHQEFAAAAVEHDTVVEINILAMLLSKRKHVYKARFIPLYLEYLAELKARGVRLSLGSDAHNYEAYKEMDLEYTAKMLESVGITENDLWILPPRIEGS